MRKNKRLTLNSEKFRNNGKGIIEDSTEYGEFICTFDSWLSIEEQKRNAEFMEHLGDWAEINLSYARRGSHKSYK